MLIRLQRPAVRCREDNSYIGPEVAEKAYDACNVYAIDRRAPRERELDEKEGRKKRNRIDMVLAGKNHNRFTIKAEKASHGCIDFRVSS